MFGSQNQIYNVVIKVRRDYLIVFRHSSLLFFNFNRNFHEQMLNAYKTTLPMFEASGEGLAQSQSSGQTNTEYAQVCHKGNFWCESYVIQYLHKCKVIKRSSSLLNIKIS
jgi:hypothetical protein